MDKTSHHPAYLRVLKLQKKMFKSLQAEAKLLLGELPSSIQAYEKRNQRDFKGKSDRLLSISKSELIQKVLETEVIFIADYHTFDQNQKTALRVIRDTFQELSPSEASHWFIGIEMLSSHLQGT